MHVVEPDGEALGAEPEGLQALPLGPRREESEPSAIPNGGGQILTHVDTEILQGCDMYPTEHVVVVTLVNGFTELCRSSSQNEKVPVKLSYSL